MEQNEQKSVWLKLILPICLGIFAAAIYQNAIKTQKVAVKVWVAQKSVEPDTVITRENLSELFTETTIYLHKETPNQLKEPFKSEWTMARPKQAIKDKDIVYPFLIEFK